MVNCEMCGKQSDLEEAIIEGVILTVCEDCSRYGRVIKIKKVDNQDLKKEKKISFEPEVGFEIVEDFSTRVKNSREKLQLKQEELALKISEKVSEIHKLESGKIKPSFNIARKLERFLNIKLIEKIKSIEQKKIDFRKTDLTIGDLIRFRKSKNE